MLLHINPYHGETDLTIYMKFPLSDRNEITVGGIVQIRMLGNEIVRDLIERGRK